jgi:hypothetical protein
MPTHAAMSLLTPVVDLRLDVWLMGYVMPVATVCIVGTFV